MSNMVNKTIQKTSRKSAKSGEKNLKLFSAYFHFCYLINDWAVKFGTNGPTKDLKN